MNDEEKDIYIKAKLKDTHIPEKIDNLFNNSIKIIENKGDVKMEENKEKNTTEEQTIKQNNQNKQEKKKMPVVLKRVLASAACLTLLVGGGNLYATTQGYDNIFFMIKYMITGEEVNGKENILTDRDITISYRPIEIAKGTQIQINSLVIKDNEAKLKIKVKEAEAKETITPLTYIVKDETGTELCNYKSKQSKIKNDYQEELVLKNYPNDTKILTLEILKNDASKIATIEIDLDSKKINVIGNAEEVTKISEEELKQYFYTGDVIGFEATCLEVTDIAYINGIYNVTYKFCYSTEETKGFGTTNTVEDLPIYEMTIGLILDEKNEYSKYRVSTISEATLLEDSQEEEVNNDSEKGKEVLGLDLGFLKLENEKENKIYSPLSIKYALKMLEEGAKGDSKLQITNLIGNYIPTKYKSNSNMSLANALFIRNSFASSIKQNYINILRNTYGAEVKIDPFANANNINSWIKNKTLNLIDKILNDSDTDKDFILINALGIDMEWKEKFLKITGDGVSYKHEKFSWMSADQVSSHKFDEDKQLVSGMEITASINNYDIVKELGEENIRKTVGDEFKKWAKSLTENDWEYKTDEWFNGDLSDENIEKVLTKYLDEGMYQNDEGYISEINSNYGRIDYSTDFSLYVDENVKAFAKDLKEYEGTTLQYIGIMPTTEDLKKYVENVDETKINNIINNLKELKKENFKDGVVTKITGYIPKFKFEYELDLMEDLKQLGVTNIFENGEAELTEICNDEGAYISKAAHKANIEFTQDGIKAAAVTMLGGFGAGGSFDYIYDVPVEEIDLTFDNPYMFLIRDKETGEIWFTGTVYEPLSWEEEPERNNAY